MASSSVDSSTAVYFITGANRGIGYGITERLAARPNVLIYAAARDPSRADKLQQLTARFSTVRIVRLSVESDADHAAAVEQVEAEAGRVDIVLANAGTSKRESYQRTEVLRLDLLRECFEVNTVGPLRLFQAFFPLLGRSTDPKFVVLSTGVASIAFQARLPDFPVTCYGTSKAAVNFVTERIHVEHPNITAFPLSPGQPHQNTNRRRYKLPGHDGELTHIPPLSLPVVSCCACFLCLRVCLLSNRLGADGDR